MLIPSISGFFGLRLKNILILLLISLATVSFAQEAKPISTFESIKISGLVHLKNDGVLILSSANKKKHAHLTLLDTGGHFLWTSELKYKINKGKAPGKIWLLSDGKLLYWLNLANEKLHLALFNLYDGELLQEEKEITEWKGDGSALIPHIYNRRVILLRPNKDGIELLKIHPINSDSNTTTLLEVDPIEGGITSLEPVGYFGNSVIAYSYLTNSNHSEIDLRIFQFNFKGELINEKLHIFKSEKHAFASVALQDERLFYILPGIKGWYILGKLDNGTASKYMANSAIEGCMGFWMSRLDNNLYLDYFTEQAFEYCADVIPHGVLRKAVFFDFKEDNEQNIFIQMAEIPDAISHRSYLFEFNGNGGFEYLIAGLSEFNFFDYNKRGIRNVNKKQCLRLINDDWRFYSTNFLDDIKLKEKRHSEVISFIVKKSHLIAKNKEEKAYNFLIISPTRALIFEYLDTKRKTLHVYKIAIN